MASGSGATPFFKEVEDAIKANPPHVSDLIVLRDLCREVDAGKKPAASKLTDQLLQLDGTEDPLHAISYELFHALLARVLVQGWLSEFGLLLGWEQTLFGSRDVKVAAKWEGIIKIVRDDPESLGLVSRSNFEQAWMRAVNGLAGAIADFRDVRLPTPATMGAPPIDPPDEERVLPRQLLQAIEEFFRAIEMQFQLILELATLRLEQDPEDVVVLRQLQALQRFLEAKLPPLQDPPNDKMNRVLLMKIRIAEVKYGVGRGASHRFLDAFRPYASRSVVFSSLDREERDRPTIRGEMLGAIHASRLRQIGFYLASYGHPWSPDARATPAHLQRRSLIRGRLGGHLQLLDRDAAVTFLAAFFEDRFQAYSAVGADPSQAGENAWYETVNQWSLALSQTCSHSRHNLTEGPPNYLEHAFPRNLAGRLLHDCGVFAVRTAFTLLSVLDRIERSHPGAAGSVETFWVRFPLHVGLLIDSQLGVVVAHNEHALALGYRDVETTRAAWKDMGPNGSQPNKVANDSDPTDPIQARHKFLEDVSASLFSSDLDMPVTSTPALKPKEPVTVRSIWNSYEQKVVPSQLFTDLVGAPNTPQYQFDRRYLVVSEIEREWYNRTVVTFWNVECNKIWAEASKVLLDPRATAKARADRITTYDTELNEALDRVQESYRTEIVAKEKQPLSKALRDDPKLLLRGVRIVASARIETKLPSEQKIVRHLDEIKDPNFVFTPDYLPPFAKPEEALSVVP